MSLRENIHLQDHAIRDRNPRDAARQDHEGHAQRYEPRSQPAKFCLACAKALHRDDSSARDLCAGCWNRMDADRRVLWNTYALAKDSELTADAINLKRKLRAAPFGKMPGE